MKRISVVGLGKLGLCFAACFASKGAEVICLDSDKHVRDAVGKCSPHFFEPNLKEMLRSSGSKLTVTDNYDKLVAKTDITFFIVPTPSKSDGSFSHAALNKAVMHLAAAFKKSGKSYHLFVITSTVSPGTINDTLIPLIESTSGRLVNRDFGVCYNPAFIALGSVIRNFLRPDILLIGESDKSAGDKLKRSYSGIFENHPQVARMSIINAEVAKISLNCFICLKISFANMLGNICELIPGGDVDAITRALGSDRRVAPSYLKSGLGYGGPCFPRDNKAFTAFAKKFGYTAKIAKITDEINEYQARHLLNKILKYLRRDKTVSILGLSYKPDTPVIDESPAMMLIEKLLAKRLKVSVYDPLAMDNIRKIFRDRLYYAASVKDCFSRSSLCVITTSDRQFRTIGNDFIKHKPTAVIDCWRILDKNRLSKDIIYIT